MWGTNEPVLRNWLEVPSPADAVSVRRLAASGRAGYGSGDERGRTATRQEEKLEGDEDWSKKWERIRQRENGRGGGNRNVDRGIHLAGPEQSDSASVVGHCGFGVENAVQRLELSQGQHEQEQQQQRDRNQTPCGRGVKQSLLCCGFQSTNNISIKRAHRQPAFVQATCRTRKVLGTNRKTGCLAAPILICSGELRGRFVGLVPGCGLREPVPRFNDCLQGS